MTPLSRFGPILKDVLNNKNLDINLLLGPIVEQYRWLIQNSSDEVLITPREIKAMINLMAAKINRDNVTDTQTLTRIATEVAYDIGRQTIIGDKSLLEKFDKDFPKPQSVLRRALPTDSPYEPYQLEAYSLIQEMLYAKDHVLSKNYTDLGLGGILLEGPSKIGKTFFVNQIAEEYKNSATPNKKVYRISPSTPYSEKVNLLRKAFEEGALVIAEEFNTSLWPNKMLNNYLMGLDEKGIPTKKPGFMLIGTQNPPSFVGRSEEDPAIRRRVVKLSLDDWPQIAPKVVPKDTVVPPLTPSYTSVKTKNKENKKNNDNKKKRDDHRI